MRTRKVVLVEQVHRLVQKFNKVNFVDEKKVNCKVIVDTFAGGSGILEQVSSQLKSSLKSEDFKKYEFVNVDHLNIKKSIKLDSRLDIYDGQANGGIRLANYICAPPEGGELWMIVVNSQRKGEKLFAKAACVERAGSAKEVHVYEKCMKDAEETQE
ncbi:hypothetical protein CYMTET_53550 [Cymbomonas tetramitiformis]|uniref:Uncharacterized protein n=1 Tax=Cymbomonas tetramitiformis TaxID=36881 RepID=A0AAE0BGT1_9CHLO|nr:hypothetical protein CYMTET_53550 [Cymbomonas tetramitiformis]